MSHIESVEIHNFQSHKRTIVKLHSGVNAIVGLSDSGKSAIFRALAWPITNKPTGDSFRSNWGGDTSVCITFADDTSVERAKVGKDNLYVLNDEEEFTAFKNDIPDAIFEALNMDEINLQTQMDAPFLLSASSGDVAKTLNRIANLTNIDTSISNIRKKTQGVTRDIANVKEQIEELEKEEKAFAYLAEMEKDVERLHNIMDKWQATDDEQSLLAVLIKRLEGDQSDLEEVNGLLSNASRVEEASTTLAQLQSLSEEQGKLLASIRKIERLDVDLRCTSSVAEAEEEVEVAIKLQEQVANARIEFLKLNSMQGSIRVQQTRLSVVEEEIEELEKQFHDEFPDQCPLCGEMK